MSILIYAVADYPRGMATAERIKLITRTLKEAGHPSEIALIHATELASTVEAGPLSSTHDGTPYVYLNGQSQRPTGTMAKVLDTIRGVFGAALHLRKSHKAGQVKKVLFYTPNFLKIAPALLLAKLYKLPIYFELCEIRTSTGSAAKGSRLRALMSIGDKLTETIGPKLVDGLIVISQRIKEFYLLAGVDEQNLFYLPALVDAGIFESDLQPFTELVDKKYFLSAGSFGEKEGVSYLVEAFGLVVKKGSEALLVFTGSPSEEAKSKVFAQAKELGVSEKLLFTGFISREQLSWCYANAEALLACRTNSDFSQFGFPTKLVEYMASGTAIVATEVGAIKESLSDGVSAFIAVPEDADSIALKMKQVLENPKLAKSVGNTAKAIALNKYDYRQYIESLPLFMDL